MHKLTIVSDCGSDSLSAIWDDDLADIFSDDALIERASHVEPGPNKTWTADMAPSGGPVLGPFKTRQEALDAEVEWLERKLTERN